jgi:hypothetical protein
LMQVFRQAPTLYSEEDAQELIPVSVANQQSAKPGCCH